MSEGTPSLPVSATRFRAIVAPLLMVVVAAAAYAFHERNVASFCRETHFFSKRSHFAREFRALRACMGWALGSAKSITRCRLTTFNKWEKSFLRDGENYIGRVR
jgi:hypothetical protein